MYPLPTCRSGARDIGRTRTPGILGTLPQQHLISTSLCCASETRAPNSKEYVLAQSYEALSILHDLIQSSASTLNVQCCAVLDVVMYHMYVLQIVRRVRFQYPESCAPHVRIFSTNTDRIRLIVLKHLRSFSALDHLHSLSAHLFCHIVTPCKRTTSI